MASGPATYLLANSSALATETAPSQFVVKPVIENSPSRVFFPALDSLRFFAAAAVVFHHLEQFKYTMGLPSAWSSYFVAQLGTQGVGLFFVLSSFLLTYLLLAEVQQQGNVSIFAFYTRRALRIWPLYFLMVFIAFAVIPNVSNLIFPTQISRLVDAARPEMPQAFWLYLFMLPNLSLQLHPVILGVSQAWSIGVEEQFYLIWPNMIQVFRQRPYCLLLVFAIALVAIPVIVDVIATHLQTESRHNIISSARQFITTLCAQFRMMFAGAAAAIVLHNANAAILRIVYSRMMLSAVVSVIILGLLCQFPKSDYVLTSSFAILAVALTNPQVRMPFQSLTGYLGRISYGLYMYHGVILAVGLSFLGGLANRQNMFVFNVLFGIYGFAATTAVSAASYQFFERPLLRRKVRFTTIRSGAI